ALPNSPSKLASNKTDSHLRSLWEGSLLREDTPKPTTTPQTRHSRPPIQQQLPGYTGATQFAQQAGLPQIRQPPSPTVGGQLAARSQPKTNHHTANPAQPAIRPPQSAGSKLAGAIGIMQS